MLGEARAEISKMREPELRALLNYFAECSDRSSMIASIQQACRSALIKYQTEFGSTTRSVDKLIAEQEQLVAITRAFRATGRASDMTYINTIDAKLREAVGGALKAQAAR